MMIDVLTEAFGGESRELATRAAGDFANDAERAAAARAVAVRATAHVARALELALFEVSLKKASKSALTSFLNVSLIV